METTLGSKGSSQPVGADSAAALVASIGRKLSEDGDLRSRLEADPRGALTARGVDVPPGLELRVASDTEDVFHLVLPADPNEALADETLGEISGGRASTAGTLGSAGTASTIASCWGTASSASTLGSIAS